MIIFIEGAFFVFFALLFAVFLAYLIDVIMGNKEDKNSKTTSKQDILKKQLVAGLAMEDIPEGEAEFKARIGIFTKRKGDEVTYEVVLVNNTTHRV